MRCSSSCSEISQHDPTLTALQPSCAQKRMDGTKAGPALTNVIVYRRHRRAPRREAARHRHTLAPCRSHIALGCRRGSHRKVLVRVPGTTGKRHWRARQRRARMHVYAQDIASSGRGSEAEHLESSDTVERWGAHCGVPNVCARGKHSDWDHCQGVGCM
jgi:hypothetical protein